MRTTSRTGRYTLRGVAAVFFALGALSLAATGASASHLGTGNRVGPDVDAEFIPFAEDKNPTCIEFEGTGQSWTEVKHDAPPSDTTVSDATVSIQLTHASGASFDWKLTSGADEVGGIDAVLVKSGSGGHNLYHYDDPDKGAANFGEALLDDGLTGPTQQGISHVSFCYDLGGGPTTTTTEEETTTTEEETTTTVEETTTTEAPQTTEATVQATVAERETEVAGVQVTQPAPAVESAQLARTGLGDWLAPLGVALIALGVAALRMSRAPRPVKVIAR